MMRDSYRDLSRARPIDRSIDRSAQLSSGSRRRSLGVLVLGVGSATAPQSTRSPARCIHTPHVWSPTGERETRRCPVVPPRAPSPAGPPAYACRTACERPERVYRACTCGFSPFLSPPLPSPPLSLSHSLGMDTGPYVLWMRTCRFPLPPRPRIQNGTAGYVCTPHPADWLA